MYWSSISKVRFVSWLVLRVADVPGLLVLRVFASHSSGWGHLFSMHLVRLCPSPNGRIPVPWFWSSLVCFSMLAGVDVVLLAFSFFIRCDLRGLPIENMLTVAVVSLVADGSLVVWSCGHQSSFSSSCSHCVSSFVAFSSFAGLVVATQTLVWGVC